MPLSMRCAKHNIMNPIHTVTRSTGIEGLPCIGSKITVLSLDRNPIKRIEARHAVIMKSIRTLHLRYISSLDEVADYMDLQHYSRLDLRDSNVNLCKCQHAWMKVAVDMGTIIHVSDMVCGSNKEM